MAKRKMDKRLLGIWRSDRHQTMNEWRWSPRVTAARRARVSDLFGHLTIRYTRGRIYSDFKGSKESQEYEVIGADASSVAIMHGCAGTKERTICHIHFDGDRRYWISLGGQREWFRRIRPPRQAGN
jgi:hypothetical protein